MGGVVAIVGRASVGKSTIFNRIVGERISIVEDVAGVTRDRIYATATWLTKEFRLIDTGGIELKDASFVTQIKIQAEIAIEEADLIVFVVNGFVGFVDAGKTFGNAATFNWSGACPPPAPSVWKT